VRSRYQGVFFESAAVRSNEVIGLKSRSLELETSKPVVPLHIHHKKTIQSKPMGWSSLVPVLCVAALGCAFIPYFALGLAVGVVKHYILTGPFAYLLNKLPIPDPQSKDLALYNKLIDENMTRVMIWGPIIEEVWYRWLVQTNLMTAFLVFAPTLLVTPFFSTGLSVAAAASIVCASLYFGWDHLGNSDNNDSYKQAIHCTIAGMIYGVLAMNFGLGAPIAAHIANNTLCTIQRKMRAENKDKVLNDAEDEVEASPSMAFAP
jgi:membrane protease YdiL (CAAX protease family)